MGTTVQARLDDKTQAALERASKRLGWSTSKVVQEGIRLVEKQHTPSPPCKLIGVGMYDSGLPDLATNKKYMEDFGMKSMGRAARRPARGSSK